MFSHFVYHITGVAVMVLALQSLDIPISSGSNKSSEPRMSYSPSYRIDCKTVLVDYSDEWEGFQSSD